MKKQKRPLTHYELVQQDVLALLRKVRHRRKLFGWLNDIPAEMLGEYSSSDLYWDGRERVTLTYPLDKVLINHLISAFKELGWEHKSNNTDSYSHTVRLENNNLGEKGAKLTLHFRSNKEGTTCKLVKISSTTHTFTTEDGVYEVVCNDLPEEENILAKGESNE